MRYCKYIVCTLLLIATTGISEPVTIFTESFESPNDPTEAADPTGWSAGGHPNYWHLVNTNTSVFSTDWGEQGVSSYSTGIGTASSSILTNTVILGYAYVLYFNVCGPTGYKGEYKAELLADDGVGGITVLGEVSGDSPVTTDVAAYSNSLTVVASSNEGERLAIRLSQDPLRADWHNTPKWDNIILTEEAPPPAGSVFTIK